MTTVPRLIVGLGNPGKKYDQTRHNIGFEGVESLARIWQLSWQNNPRFKGELAEGYVLGANKIYLLKPLTYMNRSGESIRSILDWYKLSPQSLLIIYDDMDLSVGRLRIRLSGSAGGHNGMKSAISHIGGNEFPRLRIGIGKSNFSDETISHVLGRFSPKEREVMKEVLNLMVKAVELSLKEGLEKAMSLYNGESIALEG